MTQSAILETVTSSTTSVPVGSATPDPSAEIVVINAAVSPDIVRLADQAGTWAAARSEAIEAGLIDASSQLPDPTTDLSLLPQIDTTPSTTTTTAAPEVEETPDPDPVVDPDPVETGDGETADPDGETPDDEATDPDGEPTDPGGETPDDPDGEVADPVVEDSDPAEDPEIEDDGTFAPTTPVQVNGRVPPPAGGPTAEQWDELRNCESTHNYRAVSPTGKFRGAYQFSIQTWDWVAGIHYPHLVGIDPIDAEPAWQDVMAYTLFAMSGWGQWPECGVHLL